MLFCKDFFFFFFLKKAAHWMVYSLEKCNRIFLHGPPFHRKCGKNIWKTFFRTLSEGLADSRMERINSRCEGAQGNSKTFFCLSLLNVHEDKINICVWCAARASQSRSYLHIKIRTYVIISLSLAALAKIQFIVLICTRYSKNVIPVFLMT